MRQHINHYKCSMCEMTCPKPATLATHFRYRHLKEKPFSCKHCDYTCVGENNLRVHLKSHVPNNEFKCSICPYESRCPNAMKRHIAKLHNKQSDQYECHVCLKRFGRGYDLTKHLKRVHNYHWPAGHSRFRFKLEQKGVHRLQTVRYETLDVTEAIVKENKRKRRVTSDDEQYRLVKSARLGTNNTDLFELVTVDKKSDAVAVQRDEEETSGSVARKEVIITINDVDDKGNLLRTTTMQSEEIASSEIDVNTKEELVVLESNQMLKSEANFSN